MGNGVLDLENLSAKDRIPTVRERRDRRTYPPVVHPQEEMRWRSAGATTGEGANCHHNNKMARASVKMTLTDLLRKVSTTSTVARQSTAEMLLVRLHKSLPGNILVSTTKLATSAATHDDSYRATAAKLPSSIPRGLRKNQQDNQ
jgi:hypothetical protein